MSTETSKARTRRLASIAMPSRLNKTLAHLTHRDVILRFVLMLGMILFMAGTMRVWNPPFSYYVGKIIHRDIVARVPFVTYNLDETEKNREIAGSRVPYIYTRNNDNETLVSNMNRILKILEEAMDAESLEALPPELREQFLPLEGMDGTLESQEESRVFFKFLHSRNKPVPLPPPVSPPVSSPESSGKSETEAKGETTLPAPPSPAPAGLEKSLPVPAAVSQLPANLSADGNVGGNSESNRVSEEKPRTEVVIPPLENTLSRVCSNIAQAMEPFFRRGLLHVSEVAEDPLGRGLQSQIDILEADASQQYSLQSRRETVSLSEVLIERNPAIREAIRQAVGSDEEGDNIYYCLCRNWKSNLVRDITLTQQAIKEAEDGVAPVVKQYEFSQRIVTANVQENAIVATPLTPAMVSLLRIENQEWNKTQRWSQKVTRSLAAALFMILLLLPTGYYISLVAPRIVSDFSRLTFVLFLSVAALTAAIFLSTDTFRYGLFPLILYGQLMTIQYRRRVGIVLAAILAIFVAMAVGMSLLELLFYLGVLLVVILPLDRLRGRMQFVKIAIFATFVTLLLAFCIRILGGAPLGYNLLEASLYNGLQLILAGLLIQGLLPFLERWLGVLSDARLLELCDISNPLLNELVNRAPSTYNHSIALGTIAEKAADAIHADGLLVRTAAYYHDIGKIYKPEYYAENQTPETGNPHDVLEPTMSALIIIAHVKNGIDLARQYKLPEPIIDLIEQHHGTTLVSYFYTQAKNRSALDSSIPDVEEVSFRYPCTKPQTKEAVVLMLADACESACRSLVDPAPARIENMVRKISQQRLEDDQLDESGMTLSELRIVEDSIIKGLISYHHGRIKYPERIVVKPT
ncbi:MAG: HDIG domain-containing protein [Planctomycetia bacterium]|nr:HDIG domain-containing protein [Planctomycetia bacterium]